MKQKNIFYKIAFGLLIIVVIKLTGCSSTKETAIVKSGAQMWGESCIKCHNSPSPDTFSDVEWEVAMMHMRVRAKLTEEESKKIADFLKTAN